MKEIKVTFHYDGTVTYDFDGFKGIGCKKMMDDILNKVKNMTQVSQVMKPESYITDDPMLANSSMGKVRE